MVAPGALTATQLAEQVGLPQPTLSKWPREAHRAAMATRTSAPERPVPTGQPKTAEDKLRLVLAAEQLAPDERGAFLRRQGVHDGELEAWRAAMLQVLGGWPTESGAPRPVRRSS
ncbi:hypothetical protein WMF18_40430 [Sorangium sp. So ce315]|uniref:hypothetical protein n=1 Tax=Sorangium sp. So ce315 TaxID=3133299 RepID=UPI003F5F8A0C